MDFRGFPRMGTASAGHAERENTATESGSASEDGFASIGLPVEAGWYVSAALYWIGGLAVVLIDQLASTTSINPVIGLLGTIALACSPLMLLGARFAPDASWGAPVRVLVPSVFFAVGAFVVGDAINALAILFLLPVLAVAYMHKPILAIPYCSFSLIVMNAMLLFHDNSDDRIARAIILTGVTAAVVAGLILMQNRLRQAAALNHSRSITDPLTGLANLRGLRDRLTQELQRSSRDNSEIVMFAIDLDDFKEVNDRFSYALGDAVLQAVAQALAEEIEPGDLLVRRGGDEFAILTIATPGRHMARFRDRIAASIERTRRAICPGVNPRASVTRVMHRPGESAEAFLRRVDDGLHSAKIDAHPERASDDSDVTGDHPELDMDERATRMLDGARRAQLGLVSNSRRRGNDDIALGWRVAAGTSFVSAALISMVVIPGLLPSARNLTTLLCVLGLLGVSAGSLAAAHQRSDRHLMHLPVAAMLLLTILCIADAGSARYALAELCILPVPLAVLLLGWRQAMPYAVIASATYAYIVVDSGEPFAIMQAVLMIGVLTVLTVLLARGDRLAGEFSAAAEAMSIVDPLTGASNLRGFAQRLDQEIARSDAMGDEVCLAMIDLERFKDVNDRYSHSMGDALLIETTRAIESVVREDELVVRRGGDEFVVVCAPGVRIEMDALASRLSQAILSARVRLTPDLVAGATVVNVYREDGETAGEFTRRADEELRLAKQGGRHRVARG